MEKVADPVCGMMIAPEAAAATAHYNGVTYYFCSNQCKLKFEAEPAKFTGK